MIGAVAACIVVLVAITASASVIWRQRARMVEREQNWLHWADDEARKYVDLRGEIASSLGDGLRYEVVLADWGSDFTGEADVLPRWRWVVLDADRALRHTLGFPAEIGTEDAPFMLGNATTSEEALLEAARWAETQQHPLRVVYEIKGG